MLGWPAWQLPAKQFGIEAEADVWLMGTIGRMQRRGGWAGPLQCLAAAATGAALGAIGSNATAQTLTSPNPPARQQQPSIASKPAPDKQAKTCAAFGPGFVTLPGSDICVKIGGWAETEGSSTR